jgi:hypothetical protein
MTPHPYLYEKLLAEHRSQIQHDMQQIRMLAHVGHRRTFMRSTVGSLGTLLRALGSHLQRPEQRNPVPLHSS